MSNKPFKENENFPYDLMHETHHLKRKIKKFSIKQTISKKVEVLCQAEKGKSVVTLQSSARHSQTEMNDFCYNTSFYRIDNLKVIIVSSD